MYFYEFRYKEQLQICLDTIPFGFSINEPLEPTRRKNNNCNEILETNVKVFFPKEHYDKKNLIKDLMKPYFTQYVYTPPVIPIAKLTEKQKIQRHNEIEDNDTKNVKFTLPNDHVEEHNYPKPNRIKTPISMDDRLIFHFTPLKF